MKALPKPPTIDNALAAPANELGPPAPPPPKAEPDAIAVFTPCGPPGAFIFYL
jgi:hypothetical protein